MIDVMVLPNQCYDVYIPYEHTKGIDNPLRAL